MKDYNYQEGQTAYECTIAYRDTVSVNEKPKYKTAIFPHKALKDKWLEEQSKLHDVKRSQTSMGTIKRLSGRLGLETRDQAGTIGIGTFCRLEDYDNI